MPSSRTTRTAKRPIDPVTAYAQAVVSGEQIACRLVKLAGERHLRDLREGAARGLVWKPESAQFAIDFFPYLRHSKGKWAGTPVTLEPWQQFLVGSVWGWKRLDGTRRFRTVYQEVPKKNGKSLMLSGIGLLCLVADGEGGAEVYSAASTRDQARLIFDEAKRMVGKSPELSATVLRFKKNMSVDATASKFEPLSADSNTSDGINPSAMLVDELHRHRSRDLLDLLTNSGGARAQPLLWIITTAGDDTTETVYDTENKYAQDVLEGVVSEEDGDSYLSFITTIDKGDRWDDPKAWAKANPNLGVSVALEELRSVAMKAKNAPAQQTAFKRLRLNVRTAAAGRVIDIPTWKQNTAGPDGPARTPDGRFDPALLHGERCFGGLDLSSKVDLTAWVKLFPPTAARPLWTVVPRFWLPEDTIAEKSDRDRVQYARWVDNGLIEVTQGNVVDHTEVEAAVIEDARNFELIDMAYDGWNALQMAVNLQNAGIQAMEFVQGVKSYNAPTKEFLAMVTSRKLDHADNPVLTWMAGNLAVTKPDKNLNFMPSKMHSTGRIDGMSALIMAIGRAINPDNSASIYETQGVRSA